MTTTSTLPLAPPADPAETLAAQVETLIATMRRHRAVRVRLPDGLEVELSPTSFDAVPVTAPSEPQGAPEPTPEPALDVCPCSHLAEAHMNGGCVLCGSSEKCGPDGAIPREP